MEVKGIGGIRLYIDIQNRITIREWSSEMKKSEEEIIYHMELIDNLLNGNIPTEKEEVVLEYLLCDDEWREVVEMEILLRSYGKMRKEWN
jgi:hypothetical protein